MLARSWAVMEFVQSVHDVCEIPFPHPDWSAQPATATTAKRQTLAAARVRSRATADALFLNESMRRVSARPRAGLTGCPT